MSTVYVFSAAPASLHVVTPASSDCDSSFIVESVAPSFSSDGWSLPSISESLVEEEVPRQLPSNACDDSVDDCISSLSQSQETEALIAIVNAEFLARNEDTSGRFKADAECTQNGMEAKLIREEYSEKFFGDRHEIDRQLRSSLPPKSSSSEKIAKWITRNDIEKIVVEEESIYAQLEITEINEIDEEEDLLVDLFYVCAEFGVNISIVSPDQLTYSDAEYAL